jgi:peptide/nickel transport system substrate-binding protein
MLARTASGARFHDGSPVTPEAVRASIEKLLPRSLYLRTAGIEALGVKDADLVVAVKRPFSPLPEFFVDNSVPILSPASFDASGEVSSLIGTGPFKVARLDLPRSVELMRHDAYWRGPAEVASAAYEAVVNGETRANLAVAGDADIVMNIAASAVPRVQASGAMRIDRVIIPRVHVLMVDVAKPQFADVRMRQALSLAIDRAGIAASIMRNPALAATQYLPPTLASWHFPDLAPHRQDVAKANALLDAAGWPRGPDGVRSRAGVRFAGTLRTFANRPELPVIATALQAQFRAVGFDLAIQVGEWQAIVEAQRDGTLDLGLSSRNTTLVPNPIATLAVDFTSDTFSPGATGATNWRHEGIRRDIAAYLAATDEAARAPLRRAIAGVLHTELPVIPIVWYDQIAALAPRVRGFVNDPFEQRWLTHGVSLTA